METLKYNSGLISQSFWFIEFKKVVKLLAEGKTSEEIKIECIDRNIFGAAKEYRAKRIYGYLLNRVRMLDDELIKIFISSDLATQKIINLIAILKNDRLFFEFLYEVYREKNILGVQTLSTSDINVFFKNKEIQSEDIARWTDGTKRKLSAIYINYMTDANLLSKQGKQTIITTPILDMVLENYLKLSGNKMMIKAITGVN